MNQLHNEIALQYRQSLVLNEGNGTAEPKAILGLLAELAQVGYTLDKPVMDVLKTYNTDELSEFHGFILTTINGMIGNNVKHRPLFVNFPTDVPDDDTYLLSRMVGHLATVLGVVPDEMGTPLSCGHVIDSRLFDLDNFGACPICQCQVNELDGESDRPALKDITKAKVISLGEYGTIVSIFKNLINAKSSISDTDKTVIESLIKYDKGIVAFVPSEITFKENMATTVGAVLNNVQNEDEAVSGIKHFVKTATDVLRVAYHLSGGDVSLADKQSRIKLSNPQRRIIMALLDNIQNPEEDMMMSRMRFIHLGEVLHIGQKAKKYPNAYKAFDLLRNNPETINTFNRSVEAFVKTINQKPMVGTEKELLGLLRKRPGMLARRLDWMLRTFENPAAAVLAFCDVLEDLPIIMLMTISTHLRGRTAADGSKRFFMPKGSIAKLQASDDDRKLIDDKLVFTIDDEITAELELRFSKLDSLGRVYLNPDLGGVPIPTGQRSASKSLITLPRGAHVPLPDNNAMRMFIYWHENEDSGRVDVDLSAVAYDTNWNKKYHLSYTGLSNVGGHHSGDVQSAPNGASEFIDIDTAIAASAGVRYVSMNVISYTHQPFSKFECFAGVMGRDAVDSGEIFEPTTVINKFDVAGETGFNVPLVFDIEKRELIWGDMALGSRMYNNVENNAGSIVEVAQMIENMPNTKPTLGDLFLLHCNGRATQVDFEREEGVEYDIEFDMDRATQIDDILANWL